MSHPGGRLAAGPAARGMSGWWLRCDFETLVSACYTPCLYAAAGPVYGGPRRAADRRL